MIFAAVFIGGLVGFLAERFGLSRNGYVVSVALGVGGAVLLWVAQNFLGINLGLSRALTSAVGAAAMLIVAGMRR